MNHAGLFCQHVRPSDIIIQVRDGPAGPSPPYWRPVLRLVERALLYADHQGTFYHTGPTIDGEGGVLTLRSFDSRVQQSVTDR